ncbi:MAG: allophanate hydrolase subunit 1 [Sporichthyaceae bacterium]|nr:allophanate hydrolase subunit 1 [Sporichthyaceae bacterium]
MPEIGQPADSERILPYGERALLLELPDLTAVVAAHRALRSEPIQGLVDLVPAARTILATFDPAVVTPVAVADWLTQAAKLPAGTHGEPDAPSGSGPALDPGQVVRIQVRYDGVDLPDVAELTGLTVEEVVRRHTAADYVVAFCGFTPGFGYLSGGDPALRVPRLADPRTQVPAGSVAIADEYTGIYPRKSPGGWRLLGRTRARLWDLSRNPPALLSPGTRVRFVAIGAYDSAHDDSVDRS